MRIGIATFHRAHNCGAMLQSLALQETLKKMGHNPVFLNTNAVGEWKTIPEFPTYWKCWPFYFLDLILSIGVRYRKIVLYKQFLKYLAISFERTTSEIDENNYDMFIAGSDQIWNPETAKNVDFFLLEFCKNKNKKVAYAASFGMSTLPECYKEKYAKAFNNFKAISVREDQGKKIVQELVSKDIAVVAADPTLLLTPEEYAQYEAPKLVNEAYVLVYSIGAAPAYMLKIGEKIAKEKKMKVIFVNATSFGSWINCFSQYQLISPDRFLSYIKYAEYVITTSYHATIFSILYNRPFITILADGSKTTSRMIYLLKLLGLSNRLIREGEDVKRIDSIDSINYCEVHCKIKEYRHTSLQWLYEHIGR